MTTRQKLSWFAHGDEASDELAMIKRTGDKQVGNFVGEISYHVCFAA